MKTVIPQVAFCKDLEDLHWFCCHIFIWRRTRSLSQLTLSATARILRIISKAMPLTAVHGRPGQSLYCTSSVTHNCSLHSKTRTRNRPLCRQPQLIIEIFRNIAPQSNMELYVESFFTFLIRHFPTYEKNDRDNPYLQVYIYLIVFRSSSLVPELCG